MEVASSTTTTTQVIIQKADTPSDPPMCMTQHSILQITLTGPSLISAILAIIISIQVLQPSLTCTLLALAPLPFIIYNDYENFLSLGPGGTPSTFLGYLKIAYLRLFALSDPYTPATFSEKIYPATGYYQRAHTWLPERTGPRPKIAGISPRHVALIGSRAKRASPFFSKHDVPIRKEFGCLTARFSRLVRSIRYISAHPG